MYLTIHQHLRLGYRTETTTVVSNLGRVLSQNQINLYQMTSALFRFCYIVVDFTIIISILWHSVLTLSLPSLEANYCFAEPVEMFERCHWRLGTLVHREVSQLLNNLIVRFCPLLSKIVFTSIDSFLCDTSTKSLDFDKVSLSGISHIIYRRGGKVSNVEFKSHINPTLWGDLPKAVNGN